MNLETSPLLKAGSEYLVLKNGAVAPTSAAEFVSESPTPEREGQILHVDYGKGGMLDLDKQEEIVWIGKDYRGNCLVHQQNKVGDVMDVLY